MARDAPTPAADAFPLLEVRVPWLRLWWWTATVALLVALDQVSRLFASVLTSDGSSWGLGELMGPTALLATDGWQTPFGPQTFRGECLALYLRLDAVLILLYVVGGLVHVLRRFRGRARTGLLVALGVLAAVDATEDLLAALVAASTTTRTGLITALPWLSTAKFVVGTGLVLVLLWSWRNRVQTRYGEQGRPEVPDGGVAPVTWRQATWLLVRQHRLSFVPVVVLGLLLVAPGANILDQMPDVERRWAVGTANFVLEGGLGLVALLVLGVALLVLGRARTALACTDLQRPEQPADPIEPTGPPAGEARRAPRTLADREGRSTLRDLGLWLVGPVVVGVLALVLHLLGAPVSGWRYLIFCAVPILVVAISLPLRSRSRQWRRPVRRGWPEVQLARLGSLGDGLALSVLALGSIGAVRALTPVLALRDTGQTATLEPYAVAVLGIGVAGVLLLWPAVGVVYAVGRVLVPDDEETSAFARVWRWLTPRLGDPQPDLVRGGLPVVMLAVSGVTFLLLGVAPTVAARAGVLFVFTIGLTALTGITAGAGLLAAQRPTAEVFRALRLRSTPVATLLLVAVVAAGLVDGGRTLHGVRSATAPVAASAAEQRTDLTTLVGDWADARSASGCARRTTVDGRPVDLLPMVFLASEGGGIRAAYWTAAVSEKLTGCADGSVVLSSGVSGGAVGLAAARYDDHPLQAVTRISNSRALSNALAGLLVRDFTFSATGVPLPYAGQSGWAAYTDRAGLMEDAWAADAQEATGAGPDAWGSASFADPTAVRSSRVGAVVLNSMSVGDACRVWVSEVRLRPDGNATGASPSGGVQCDANDVSGIRSVDLLSTWSEPRPDPTAGTVPATSRTAADDDTCLHGVSVLTAALLAARFPYVTPSGRVGPCAHRQGVAPADQLVDGGYLENTGLGTVVDLADVWLPAVQRWNVEHATPGPGGARPLVVPVVLYLDNGTGADRTAPQRKIVKEALLPPLAELRAGGTQDATTLQRADDVVQPTAVCGPTDQVCQQAVAGLDNRVFLAFPASRPQIAAPLGWILSDASRASLDAAATEDATVSCDAEQQATVTAGCRRGYGSLQDLLDLVGG